MSDTDGQRRILDHVPAVPTELRRAAMRTVASRVGDPVAAREVLDMLGLLEEPARTVDVSVPFR